MSRTMPCSAARASGCLMEGSLRDHHPTDRGIKLALLVIWLRSVCPSVVTTHAKQRRRTRLQQCPTVSRHTCAPNLAGWPEPPSLTTTPDLCLIAARMSLHTHSPSPLRALVSSSYSNEHHHHLPTIYVASRYSLASTNQRLSHHAAAFCS